MKHTLDPTRIKEIRKNRSLAQKELTSNRRGLSLRAIQRYEKEPMDVDEQILEFLAKKLKVKSEVLTGDLPMPTDPSGTKSEASARTQSVKLSVRAQLNLDLIAYRYTSSIDEVIELAPVLFFLFAEQALRLRAKIRHEKLTKLITGELPAHLYTDGLLQDLEAESEAIRNRKVYSTEGYSGDYNEFSPDISAYRLLGDQINELGLERDISDFHDDLLLGHPYHGFPSATVCIAELTEISGGDNLARTCLTQGVKRVSDIPKHLLEPANTFHRIQWLRECWVANEDLTQDFASDESVPS